MKIPATFRHSLVISLLCSLSAFGQTPPAELPSKEDVLESLTRSLEKVESVEFQTSSFLELTDIYRKRNPSSSPSNNVRVDLHFVGKGQKYFYTRGMFDSLTDAPLDTSEQAFNGKIFQRLDPGLRALIFNERDVFGRHLSLGYYSPLHMFGFLMPAMPGPSTTITWPGLKDASIWQKTFEGAKVLRREEVNGKSCLVIQFAQSKNKLFEVDCRYTGYFSELDGFFPMAWKAHDLRGRILEEYTIAKLGRIPLGSDAFYFPEEATDRCYTKAEHPAGEPQTITTITTRSFAINDADDHVFAINPKKYDSVVDEGRQQAYKLPK
jgi:hypothetical protein